MKKVLIPLTVLILVSCTSRKENKTTPQAAVPKALQDHKENKLISYSKRGPEDLVEELYDEKVRSSPALKAIEELIERLNKSKNDSLEVFNDFKTKNQQYYGFANSHLNSIKDSVLKKEIEAVIEKNLLAYKNRTSRLEDLVTSLNNRSGSADDGHTALMIVISLGMMNEYQQKNMPSTKSIETVINDYDRLIQKMDSVINKNK
jgi:hypothetical protein